MQLAVTDTVATTFIRLLGAGPSTTVPAKSTCGLSNVLSAVPILVLNPNAPNSGAANTLTANSGSSLTVFGGSQKSIQVNSSDAAAVDLSSATVDLSNANNDNGGNFAVVTRESQADANVTLANTKSHWVNAAGMTSDPFAMIDAPSKPADHAATAILDPCPGYDPAVKCEDYQPGYYPATQLCNSVSVSICIGSGGGSANSLAVFEPGIYYLDGDFATSNGKNSCIRPGVGIGDGSGGTMFYLHGSSTLNKSPNGGPMVLRDTGNVVFACADPTFGVPVSSLSCVSNIPPGVATLTGNVLLAPCTGPYGDPLGGSHERGLLFFHDRDTQPTTQPSWRAASSFALVGSLYFHRCNTAPAGGSGVNCDPSAFTETLTLSSGANAYVIGNIVADQLNLGGAMTVGLSPKAEYYTLKASLLQ
jgi:hypothetical protein